MSHVTRSDSPYPGLALFEAILVGLPLLWLPLTVARIFRRARAGYALLLLPLIMWLINNGTILIGTEYGLSDAVSTLRVYALYGIAASSVFFSLSLVLLFSTYRLSTRALIGITILMGSLAGFGDLFRAQSGWGVAVAVCVLWWMNSRRRWRWLVAIAGALVALILAISLQTGVMYVINLERVKATGQAMGDLPVSHGAWHSVYLGLSYPQPITGQESRFGIPWSDKYGWDKAREIDPTVILASEKYDLILKDLYLDEVASNPIGALKLYAQKTLFVIKHFGAMLIFIMVGFAFAFMRRTGHRKHLGTTVAISLPMLALGMVPPVLVMPLLYYYSELSAALGLLVAVSLGAIACSLVSAPTHNRISESGQLGTGIPAGLQPTVIEQSTPVTVIIPCRNGPTMIGETANRLAELGSPADEIIVVEDGSSDDTAGVLVELANNWRHGCTLVTLSSEPGLGEALRMGVLASKGERLLLTGDDLPFGMSDYEEFSLLPASVVLAIGSRTHPLSRSDRNGLPAHRSKVFRFLREALLQSRVGDSQGTMWLDGNWARAFATVSRESGVMWTTELVLAAEQQRVSIVEVPVVLRHSEVATSSRFRVKDLWQSVIGFVRLVIYKDDYDGSYWATSGVTNRDLGKLKT